MCGRKGPVYGMTRKVMGVTGILVLFSELEMWVKYTAK